MRQLLIIAIETPDALDIDHLAIHVPALIQDARGYGTIINGDLTQKVVVAAAKECVERLPTERNVGIFPEMSRTEWIQGGLRMLADIIPAMSDLDACVREWKPKKGDTIPG